MRKGFSSFRNLVRESHDVISEETLNERIQKVKKCRFTVELSGMDWPEAERGGRKEKGLCWF